MRGTELDFMKPFKSELIVSAYISHFYKSAFWGLAAKAMHLQVVRPVSNTDAPDILAFHPCPCNIEGVIEFR